MLKTSYKCSNLDILTTSVQQNSNSTIAEAHLLSKQLRNTQKFYISIGRRLLKFVGNKNVCTIRQYQYKPNLFDLRQSITLSQREHSELLNFISCVERVPVEEGLSPAQTDD